MCIRDRVSAIYAAFRPYAETQKYGIFSLPKALTLQNFKDCLLYTSDAADERSSVDLGGRRIIKKTKNSTHIR